ncbi:MAG TPA: hypothetical protein VMH85_13240 [Terriglobales bacterium]|nr:hypothetical protein [Terriglobales bacterium]
MDSFLENLVIVFALVGAMFLFILTFHAETDKERKMRHGRKL